MLTIRVDCGIAHCWERSDKKKYFSRITIGRKEAKKSLLYIPFFLYRAYRLTSVRLARKKKEIRPRKTTTAPHT